MILIIFLHPRKKIRNVQDTESYVALLKLRLVLKIMHILNKFHWSYVIIFCSNIDFLILVLFLIF